MNLTKLFPIPVLILANSTLLVQFSNTIFQRKDLPEKPSVEVRKTADGHVLAVVKNHSGYPNTVFGLQTTESTAPFNPIVLDNVDIVYSNDCVVFRSKTDNRNLVLKLNSSSCSYPTSNNIGVYKGYGVIMSRNPAMYGNLLVYGGSTYPPITQDIVCDCNENNISDEGCSSGGTGASSCSMETGEVAGISGGSCTVVCGTGYYACCYND